MKCLYHLHVRNNQGCLLKLYLHNFVLRLYVLINCISYFRIMLKLKIFITFFTLVLLASSFDEKEQVFSRQGNSKAFYNTSYGRLAFNEILIKRKVKNDEFLSNIFERNRLGYDNLQKLIEQPDSLFNERRIRVGNNYGVTYKFINNKITPEKFIYEKNKVDFIVATLSENFDLELKQKDIEIKSFSTSGEINSSLYLTMQENNINPLLAIDLSEIYAWTIDFYKIQKGDKFKIIYTEEFVEGKSLNQFKINASTFTHRGVEKEAYFYKGKDEIIGHFYDENGHIIETSLSARMLSVSLEGHKGDVIAVSGGEEKVEAIRAALKGGLLTGLITDEFTARAILTVE